MELRVMELDHTNLPPTWPTVKLDLKEILALEAMTKESNNLFLNIIKKGYETPFEGNNLYELKFSDYFIYSNPDDCFLNCTTRHPMTL